LISPYLQFNDRIKEQIDNLHILKKDIRIIYRENKLHLDENNWLAERIGVRTSVCKNLHAKCYLNENEAIITSMNLYEYSQMHNDEMGIHVLKNEDGELYNSIWNEAQRLLTLSQELKITIQKVPPDVDERKADKKKTESNKTSDASKGYCIRTGSKIPFDVEKPLSYDAFKEWSKFENKDYPEKFCHFSGEPSGGETSVSKPIMKKNWKKAKEVFNL